MIELMTRRIGALPPASRIAVVALLAITVASCRGGQANQEADPLNGESLARQWCAACHRVAPDQPGETLESAPSFMEIAGGPEWDRERLMVFMGEDHLPMPTFRLWGSDREDLAVYILQLGGGATVRLGANGTRDPAVDP